MPKSKHRKKGREKVIAARIQQTQILADQRRVRSMFKNVPIAEQLAKYLKENPPTEEQVKAIDAELVEETTPQ